MPQPLYIYWIRRDFRLRDNPALTAAVTAAKKNNVPLLPLFILEPYMTAGDAQQLFGMPSRHFLIHALPRLADRMPGMTCLQGRVTEAIQRLAQHYTIEIFVNDDVYPDFYAQLGKIKEQGIVIHLHRDQLTVAKDTVTGSGGTYSVFTPFKKAVWESFMQTRELPAPPLDTATYEDVSSVVTTLPLTTESLTKQFSRDEAIQVGRHHLVLTDLGLPSRELSRWYSDETEALEQFARYNKQHLAAYHQQRDRLDEDGTSKMSLALTWGLVSARTLVHEIREHHKGIMTEQGPTTFISELIWREFYKYLYAHRPELASQEFQEKMRHIIWVDDAEAYRRFILWIQGKTGYPIVDAAMMQLARTGWMHNRARMIVASVLTKNLGVDWRWGQEYFRAMLSDLDEASNNGGWQWGASVGADPKPIRIFNPYLQAENHDPEKRYQTQWLDETYRANPPEPIVPHATARDEALKRYGLSKTIRQ